MAGYPKKESGCDALINYVLIFINQNIENNIGPDSGLVVKALNSQSSNGAVA